MYVCMYYVNCVYCLSRSDCVIVVVLHINVVVVVHTYYINCVCCLPIYVDLCYWELGCIRL